MELLKSEVPLLQNQYHRLLFISESKFGNTLKHYSEETGFPYININLYLSEKLKGVPFKKRSYKAITFINDLVRNENEILCIDYFEIMFDSSLQLKVFDILKNISRNKTLLVCWRGAVEQGFLVHAVPGHSEYKREIIADFKLIY